MKVFKILFSLSMLTQILYADLFYMAYNVDFIGSEYKFNGGQVRLNMDLDQDANHAGSAYFIRFVYNHGNQNTYKYRDFLYFPEDYNIADRTTENQDTESKKGDDTWANEIGGYVGIIEAETVANLQGDDFGQNVNTMIKALYTDPFGELVNYCNDFSLQCKAGRQLGNMTITLYLTNRRYVKNQEINRLQGGLIDNLGRLKLAETIRFMQVEFLNGLHPNQNNHNLLNAPNNDELALGNAADDNQIQQSDSLLGNESAKSNKSNKSNKSGKIMGALGSMKRAFSKGNSKDKDGDKGGSGGPFSQLQKRKLRIVL